ncbi:MAK10-like protein [Tanacetum coccineum]
MDSLDLNGENRERTHLRLFQFSLRNQSSNWLECLPAGSITMWEDLTIRFLAQFFPPGRTAKLHNDILMFQQHHEESLSEAWTRFKDLLQKAPHHGIDLWLQDLTLYDNECWNNPRDFAKPVKAITLPQNVPSTSDRRLVEVQRLMEAHLALIQPTQLNKITTSCEICSSPHDTQYCMENPEQAFTDYASLRANEMGGNSMAPKSTAAISYAEKEELRKKGFKSPSKLLSLKYLSPASIKELNKNPSSPKRVHFVNSIVILSTNIDMEEEDISSTNACNLDLDGMVKGKEGVKEQGKEENEIGTGMEVDEVIEEEDSEFETDEEVEEIIEDEEDDSDGENFNVFPTMKELTHHEWLLKNPRPPWVKARIGARSPNNIKISCMVGHIFKKHAYIDLESPINIMSRRQYTQIMTYELKSRQKPSNPNKLSNFVGRIRGLKIFIGSFAYECNFMILEDTTSIIDHHLREMVFRRPFIDETGLVYNKEKGTVMFE